VLSWHGGDRSDVLIKQTRLPMSYGRYFEEFEVGELVKHWPGRTISEADDTWFSLLTMNQNPLHIDAHYASQTQHGQRLVVGTLVFSIVVGMSVADISGRAIANLEYEEIKHHAPVFHGDTIYAESRILDKRESQTKPDRGIVHLETHGLNQRGEMVLTLKRRVLIPKRLEEVK
jgi:acyl dehydratase